MELVFTKLAREDLDALPKQIGDRIIKKTEWYASQPMPLVFAKRLSGDLSELFRFRVGDYRVIVFQMELYCPCSASRSARRYIGRRDTL